MKQSKIMRVLLIILFAFMINLITMVNVQAESVTSNEIKYVPEEKCWTYEAATDDEGNVLDNEIIITGYSDDFNITVWPEVDDRIPYCLVIPEKIQGKTVKGMDFGKDISSVKSDRLIVSLDIPNTVESICFTGYSYYGYSGFYNLRHLELPSSIKEIKEYAFYKCTDLEKVNIPEGVVNIERYAFYGCSSLQAIALPKSLRALGEYDTFYDDELGSYEESYDEEGEYTVFADCRSLKRITVATGNSRYYDLDGVLFSDRVHTKYVDTGLVDEEGDLITEAVNQKYRTIINYPAGKIGKFMLEADMLPVEPHVTFLNAVGLTEIQVDSSNTEYNSVDGVLYSKDLKKLYVCPAGKTGTLVLPEGVERLETNAFSYSSLSSLQLSDSVKYSDDYQFYNSTQLRSIHIGQSFEDIGHMKLQTIPNLETITVSALNKNYSVIDNIVYDKKQETMLFIPGGYNGNLVIPDSVTTIGIDSDDYEYRISEVHIGKNIKLDEFIHPEEKDIYDDGTIDIEEPFIYGEIVSILKYSQKITVSKENTDFKVDSGVLYSSDMKTLIAFPQNAVNSYTIPNGVTTVYTDIFPECLDEGAGPYLTLTIPNSVVNFYGTYPVSWGKIIGSSGSATEKYAKENQLNFIALLKQLGDVYQDGKIDGKDVSLLLQYRLKKRELTEEQIAAGDVYADGKIDGKDVSKLLQYRLGKIESLE